MKKFFLWISAYIIVITCSISTNAQDLRSILSSLAEKDSTSASKKTSGLGDIIGNLISSDEVDIKQLTGTWKYSSPAVTFKSDNLLKKAGGAAASQTVEQKLASYYKIAGITNLTLTIANDSTFTINMRRSTLKGNITPITDKNSPNNFTLNFKMSGKINLGKIDANIAKAGSSTMSLTFDISKLMTIVEKVGAITGNSSVQGVSKLLNGYDGINAGFKLKK